MSTKLLVSPLAVLLAFTLILSVTFVLKNDYANVSNQQVLTPVIDLDAPVRAWTKE